MGRSKGSTKLECFKARNLLSLRRDLPPPLGVTANRLAGDNEPSNYGCVLICVCKNEDQPPNTFGYADLNKVEFCFCSKQNPEKQERK